MREIPSLRLYVNAALAEGVNVELTENQAHYILHVMRRKVGEKLRLFNGKEGEWLCELNAANKKTAHVTVQQRLSAQKTCPPFALLFAPLKQGAIDFLVEKATELGVRDLYPVRTERTVISRLNESRLNANIKEAAEQTERLDLPFLHPLTPLHQRLATWNPAAPLLYCDETGGGKPIADVLSSWKPNGTVGVLIGPEGGFTRAEQADLLARPNSVPVGLGPRILRAETAALAALAALQCFLGDWQEKPDFRG